MFQGIDISASGLTAQRLRMDIISGNIANVETTRTEDGGPYRRKVPVFQEKLNTEMGRPKSALSILSDNDSKKGVEVRDIREDQSPFRMEYRPSHPDADADGYLRLPNVNIMTEMIDMIDASRAYEASVQAISNYKNMAASALDISR
ncbi:MAG: flagellar basal body rod protein FlgC [Bacillota bacterium]